ncbi:MAG: hypothetical protein ABIS45_03410 [Burkholderiales bacterium]
MENPYQAPRATVGQVETAENNSGGGSSIEPPPGIKGWSWGAFLLNWIWSIGNRVWIGLLCMVPYIGLIMAIYIGFKGREMAWRARRWDSIEHFNEVQRKWTLWGCILVFGVMGLGILAAIVIPIFARH